MWRHVVTLKFTDVSEVRHQALMTEAVRASETSDNFHVTKRRYISEESKLHTRHRKNLK
jgi:hypothetical protein